MHQENRVKELSLSYLISSRKVYIHPVMSFSVLMELEILTVILVSPQPLDKFLSSSEEFLPSVLVSLSLKKLFSPRMFFYHTVEARKFEPCGIYIYYNTTKAIRKRIRK